MVVILSLSSLSAFHDNVDTWKKDESWFKVFSGEKWNVGLSDQDNFFLLSSNSFLLEIFPDMVPRD